MDERAVPPTPWHRERLLEAGAAEYLTKPLDVPRFLA
jgi:DNA-binding response OmpR family regulator